MSWRVSWQDYQGWRTADLIQPRPKVGMRDFYDKAEAETFAHQCRAAGLTACVSPTPAPKKLRNTPKQTAISEPDAFNKNWKLHR